MVEPIEDDARGIVAPDRARGEWSLDRYGPGLATGRLVDRYWLVRWSLPPGRAHPQRVLTHPVANLVFEDGAATLGGVATRAFERDLVGSGRALGVMFRPAGLRALVDRPASDLTDRSVSAASVLGDAVDDLAASVAEESDDAVARGLVEAWLEPLVPARPHACEATMRLVERAADDLDLARVDDLASDAAVSVRTLQRRFLDHVGVSPKWVLQRYRLYEAGERARAVMDVDWAAVAHDLGFSDQSHLVRDFAAAFGMPPARYANWNHPDGG